MWLIGFFLHEMAFGLLSIFLPLYIAGLVGGTAGLVYLGVMIAVAAFLTVPFSFFWGYLCDRTGRYKFFILLSFSSLTILLYLFASTPNPAANIPSLIILYAVMAVAHAAHEPPKNVLIAESFSRQDWEKSFAWYELLTEFGWLIGLLLGFVVSNMGFTGWTILLFCSLLNLLAFVSSSIFVSDPPLIFERGLAGIERTLDFAQRGVGLALAHSSEQVVKEKLKIESLGAFCAGLILFSLATSMLFTPLPIFFSKDLSLAQSLVFVMFVINSAGACTGYYIAKNRTEQGNPRAAVKTTSLTRAALILPLIALVYVIPSIKVLVTALVLILMGIAYALFITSTLSLSMEILPEGKAGLFNALVGLGGAAGSLIGPMIAANLSFQNVFVSSTIVFSLSFVAFKIFA